MMHGQKNIKRSWFQQQVTTTNRPTQEPSIRSPCIHNTKLYALLRTAANFLREKIRQNTVTSNYLNRDAMKRVVSLRIYQTLVSARIIYIYIYIYVCVCVCVCVCMRACSNWVVKNVTSKWRLGYEPGLFAL